MSTMNVGEYQHGESVEVHEYSHIPVHYAYPSKWVERTAALVPSTLTTSCSGLYQALGSVGVQQHPHVSVVVAYPSNQMARSIALVHYHLFGTLPWRWDLWQCMKGYMNMWLLHIHPHRWLLPHHWFTAQSRCYLRSSCMVPAPRVSILQLFDPPISSNISYAPYIFYFTNRFFLPVCPSPCSNFH